MTPIRRVSSTHVAKGLTLLVGCLLVAGVSRAQSHDGQAFAWDYPDQQVAEMDIVRFDGQALVAMGMSALPGVSQSYFTPLREMPSGQHAVEFLACSSETCFQWSAPMLFVVSPFFQVVEVKEQFGAPFPNE